MTDFAATKTLFYLPEGVIYLDGNSLGPLPKATPNRLMSRARDEWGEMLITAWNKAGWMAEPSALGDRIGRLIGAPAGTVVTGDTLSLKVHQALAAALDMAGDRRVVLSDTGNFPTDLYMAEGLIRSRGQGHELRIVAPEKIEAALSDEIAVLMLTHVDFQTGRMHDMQALTAGAHELGIVTCWDLAHSAGAVEVDLTAVRADFATGCTYKFLNGGPGAPAFIYVRPDHQEKIAPALSGWLGHETPFAFDLSYRAGPGIERMRVGTPPMLQMAALGAALDVWETVEMSEVRARAIELSDLFIALVEEAAPGLTLASPRDPLRRGSQVSFRFKEGYAAMQALIARGVIGDFRAPDIMRFGITPLYIGEEEIRAAADHIGEVIGKRLWDRPEYKTRARVT